MKIDSSAVSMSSSRRLLSVNHTHTLFNVKMKRADLDAEKNAAEDAVSDAKSQKDPAGGMAIAAKTDAKETAADNNGNAASVNISDEGRNKSLSILANNKTHSSGNSYDSLDSTISTLKMLIRMLKALSSKKGSFGKDAFSGLEKLLEKYEGMKKAAQNSSSCNALSFGSFMGMVGGSAPARNSDMVLVSRTESFTAESEFTTFSAQGIAKTEDGREINFNVDYAMSREFMSYTEINEEAALNLCDPLVINVGAGVTSVSDQKFAFDLDADGKDENISYLNPGSGFLALDKDGNGKIDNGSELFGTSSGDGFKDLSTYDEDGNGWIDENDSVFSRLKVWFKNDDGTDTLLSLKQADVGAIYLGSANTEFSLKPDDNSATNAVIRRSGIFLKESSGVGTLQHLDMAL